MFKIMAPYIPTNMSSAIIPIPPCRPSSFLAGYGFVISSTLKQIKAVISHSVSLGRNRQVIHMPTNSSQTSFLGSLSDSVTSVLQAHIPSTIPSIIMAIAHSESLLIGETTYIMIASRLPTVPDITGDKPEPNPEPMVIPRRWMILDVNELLCNMLYQMSKGHVLLVTCPRYYSDRHKLRYSNSDS